MKECKEITGLPGYFVNSIGEVFTSKHRIPGKRNNYIFGKLVKMKTSPDACGYPAVQFWINGKPVKRRVHNLVALMFIPNSKRKPMVLHRNGNKLNNKIENLYWGTNSDNMKDSIKHGIHISGFKICNKINFARGERVGISKLTAQEVISIRNKYQLGEKQASIAKEFNCSTGTISQIVRRVIWKHI